MIIIFVYDAQGRLAEMRTPEAVEARFAYDELSRLKRVEHREPQDAEALAALEYDYAPDEPDIAAQLSRRTLPLFNQQQEITDFASRFDIVLTRSKPAALGLLTYDDLTDELTLAAEPSRWNPLSYVQQSVAALRLEALLEGPQGVNTFILPSNRLFVPPEYWSVNCCMCPCDPNDPNCPPYSECEGCLPPLPPGPQTTIKYSTFIPLDHVRLSPPVSDWFYEADNTGSYIPGHFRVEQTVTVRTGSATIEGYSAQSAVSRLFQQSATNLTTAGTCFRKSCPNCAAYPGFGTPITFEGQCLVRSASDQGSSLADNMDSVRADVIEAGNATAFVNYIVVRLRGSPVIGVSPNFLIGAGSPHIDWDVTVQISYDWTTGQTTYFVLGQHDGFPFHEIQIKGTHVYGRDPIVNGNTPFSLFDPLDVNVSLQGSVP